MQVHYPNRIGLWSVGFCGGRETGELLEQGGIQQQTQPAHMAPARPSFKQQSHYYL